MGEVMPLRPGGGPRRALFSDERGTGLRATWHPERDLAVLSLWRDDVCVGTFRLTRADAARLVAFLHDHLAVAVAAPGKLPEPSGVSAARAR
jgi:hypothetical protein